MKAIIVPASVLALVLHLALPVGAVIVAGDTIGLDFGSNGATPNGDGAGQEPGFVLIGDAQISTTATTVNVSTGIAGVTLTTGRWGSSVDDVTAVAGDANQGFGSAGVGDYTGTIYSDLSVNDSFFANTNRTDGNAFVEFSGLDDSLSYDFEAVYTAGRGRDSGVANDTDVLLAADGQNALNSIADILGPGASEQLTPLGLTGLGTDGSGNLRVEFAALRPGFPLGDPGQDFERFYLVAAAELTAVAVPEPTSFLLVGMGLVGIVLGSRKRIA